MRFEERERAEIVPGSAERHTGRVRQWVCPECDYFEELIEEDGAE
jgi:predicted RNA-binding protein YlxR (DUF448 family)